MRSLGPERGLGQRGAQLGVGRRLRHHEAELQLGIDGPVTVIEELDRELGEWSTIATQLARLLQGCLPLLGLDAILLVGTILANARDLNEPSHQNSVAELTIGR
jgi:hypothetical protein